MLPCVILPSALYSVYNCAKRRRFPECIQKLWQRYENGRREAHVTSSARGDNMPRPLYAGRCGPAATHPLRLRRPARIASSSCGRHEYSRCTRQTSSDAHHRLIPPTCRGGGIITASGSYNTTLLFTLWPWRSHYGSTNGIFIYIFSLY